jgi:hypothetical protein
MNQEQINKVENEIIRLTEKKFDNKGSQDLETYIDGRIDALKWIKENI